jgi:hypothetical protein
MHVCRLRENVLARWKAELSTQRAERDAPEGQACCARDPNARRLYRDPCDSLAVQAAG